jgi:hypothetical protein
VATGRSNPISPVASYEQKIATSGANVPPPGAHAEGSDFFATRSKHPSHACEQVATGRSNPISPVASYDQKIATSGANVPPPGAHAEGSDFFAARAKHPSHACEQVATGRSNRYPPSLVMIETLLPAVPTCLHPALTLRAPTSSLREPNIRAMRVSKWQPTLELRRTTPRCRPIG